MIGLLAMSMTPLTGLIEDCEKWYGKEIEVISEVGRDHDKYRTCLVLSFINL